MNNIPTPFSYNVTITRVVDGDTVDVDIDLGFEVTLINKRVRLAGIDTPEKRTRDKVEKVFGMYATDYVTALLPVGTKTVMRTAAYEGKYGRILGDFVVGDEMLVEKMLADHVGAPYFGQSKEEIESIHENNRSILIKNGKVVL